MISRRGVVGMVGTEMKRLPESGRLFSRSWLKVEVNASRHSTGVGTRPEPHESACLALCY